VYCSIYLRTWEGGVLWFLCTIGDFPRLFVLCLYSLAGGGSSWCCCSVH
jgi:hypothetical protein